MILDTSLKSAVNKSAFIDKENKNIPKENSGFESVKNIDLINTYGFLKKPQSQNILARQSNSQMGKRNT